MRGVGRRILPLLLALLLLALPGCGGKKVQQADLQQVYDEIGNRTELPAMLTLNEQRIRNYYGIDPAACRQCILAVSDEGLRVDEIWLIEAADEKAAEALLAMARSRIEQVCAETKEYLPDQYAVAQNAQALRIGSSVALFLSPDAKEMAEIFTKAFQ